MDIKALVRRTSARLFRSGRVRPVDPLLDAVPERPLVGLVLMVPPQMDVKSTTENVMTWNGYTNCVEIEEKAGCRRFRLS